MTLYRKAEIAFDLFGVLMALAFVVTCGYCYNEYRQPELGAFIDQKIEQYDAEQTKPVVLWREKRQHYFQFSRNEPDDVYGELFAKCERNPKCYGKEKR